VRNERVSMVTYKLVWEMTKISNTSAHENHSLATLAPPSMASSNRNPAPQDENVQNQVSASLIICHIRPYFRPIGRES